MAELNINRWKMLKKLIVFQVKLAFDAVRDLLLSPVSFVCTMIDIFTHATEEKSLFNQLMKLGNKTDHWLNLFNHSSKYNEGNLAKDSPSTLPTSLNDKEKSEKNVDQIFDKIEAIIREQHKNGSVTASAKASIDFYLGKINQKSKQQPSDISVKPDDNLIKTDDKL